MKRVLKWFVVPMAVVFVILVVVANLLVDPLGTLPPPDPARLITLPDGRVESLGDLLERLPALASEKLPTAPGGPDSQQPEHASGELVVELVDEGVLPFHWPPGIAADETDLFRLGHHALRAGRLEEALALLQSVPEDHDQYDTAQRFIGWELLTKAMDKPALGLAYMNRALNAAPLEGENWQDASRVYLRTLGIRWDPVSNTMR